MDTIEILENLLTSAGGRAYFGEAVSVATHMLQAGALAEQSGAEDAVIAAALLHDIGHILGPQSVASDAHHEERGAAYLSQWFGPEVCEPVRLHVAAKRYLCTVEPEYYALLSEASRRSLELQGGPMTSEAAHVFEHQPHAVAAVAVRRWDEAAKDPNGFTPAFADFRPLLRQLSDARSGR